ncbi:NADH-ubiquinone oxidoreductase-F iron-sulfur binding region domain-containing protein [Massilia sp. Root335]|uniref:NAD(P)H-dependent oxidoreductase subunit E n=1 Tax=Massilia sp. Root335 TaxID=1736517 RepID=UPI0006FA0DB0|nr:NADH-ubiquinone oxidoreductase-F iron-sulfur binding region domain-containing protein [Massilia sp. Root335]KQV32952.1 NADH-quinone oxidoreductase subunit F [Massilia sp. Root335]
MNHPVIPIATQGPSRQRKREAPKGRRIDPQALADVQAALGDAPRRRDLLIEHLHKVQDRYGALSAPRLAALAHELKLAQSEVYEVATFYHHFDVLRDGDDAPPALTVRVCAGLSCELAGARDLLARLPAILGTQVRVLAAACIGRCDGAPAALVGQRPVTGASVDTVRAAAAGPATDVHTGHADYDVYRAAGGYRLLRACMEGHLDPESTIVTLMASGLRGLGGAGFPAGRKWRIVRNEPGPRLMAVNIDEGEPGTFKDRHYLERDPHRFLEGALVAAWAVGIDTIYLYLRDEYHGLRAMLAQELDRLRADPPVPDLPEIVLRRGAGAYICGEESAMIESIEGKRGMPRLRPPYLAQVGLFGRPTLEHNLETLHWVRDILERGAEWFTNQGRHGRRGLRSFSVSGRVREPGVKLAPAGITMRELLDEYCGGMQDGHAFYAYLPGGASGGILPASMADIPLDFDTLQRHGCFIGSAAVVVLSDRDSARAAALNTLRFFRDESCGQCTPCRAGTAKAVALMERDVWDTALLAELSQVMRDASICGLGQAAPNPFDCVVKYFPHELEGS